MATQKEQTRAANGAKFSEDEKSRAVAEDAKVQDILRVAREHGTHVPASTSSSPGESTNFMEEMRQGSAKWLAAQVEANELILRDELRKSLAVDEIWVEEALSASRLFFVSAPSGEQYFPEFFASKKYSRSMLEEVCKKLGNLPGISKYFFFTSKSTYLQSQTPLEALESDKLAEVLIAAQGFAER